MWRGEYMNLKEIFQVERSAMIEIIKEGRLVKVTIPVLTIGHHICVTGEGKNRKDAIRNALKMVIRIGKERWPRTQPLL